MNEKTRFEDEQNDMKNDKKHEKSSLEKTLPSYSKFYLMFLHSFPQTDSYLKQQGRETF